VLAEFTIFPMYRKKHIGKQAAELILKTYGGSWEIKYNEKNTAAKALWTQITDPYHPVRHSYSENETVLAFSC
jgi:predicted acetyltransferase